MIFFSNFTLEIPCHKSQLFFTTNVCGKVVGLKDSKYTLIWIVQAANTFAKIIVVKYSQKQTKVDVGLFPIFIS